ncbi:ABC transporter ATP-binding protein [Streptomyces sp. H10-C2]|uniref:ABC transporter ATP-binding protein n=1 Tax=unclassified Streptomyces TaxID=2593676 RepID=UPI0024BA2D7E|nr:MULTISPECIES: ABC transporter ATP-binding protein [unclassified Streptomyces]MDJ0343801.1 ABC transporter ATP-binding protein [Streptomyces sp. PH10-H1]MDJ0373322.1 ABC transporter ATP-binding protein [Streptomyces sp. H10-C2]
MTEPVLSVRDLRVWYGTERGPVRAVDGVSFDVRPGETLGLVGESGCGKSTLGRGVLGLAPSVAAVDGEVILNSKGGRGRNLVGMSPKELQKLRGPDLGLIFQEPMTRLNPLMKISQHFEEALHTHHKELSKKELRERAIEALRGMGIPASRYESYPHEFSGGMRQRIMIALALVLRPAFIVADEPTTALDVLVEAQIIKILADLRKNFDTSLVLITHNLGIVAEACDRVAVMYAGHIVEQGDAREVFANPQHPYTKELLRSTISLSTTGLHYIPGSPPDLVHPPEGCRFHPRCPVAMQGCAKVEPPEVVLPSGVHSTCWHQGIEADPSLADELGTGGREPLAAVKEISDADEA